MISVVHGNICKNAESEDVKSTTDLWISWKVSEVTHTVDLCGVDHSVCGDIDVKQTNGMIVEQNPSRR